MNDYLIEERRKKILEKIKEQGTVKTAGLAELFSVSEVTIRRDLKALQEKNLLDLVHGGAVAKEEFKPSYHGDTLTFQPSFEEKRGVNGEEKKKIGKSAADLVKENSSIFLGPGTTTFQVAKNLKDKGFLTVLTNSFNLGFELSRAPDIDLVMMGGELRKETSALVGPITKRSIQEIYVDTLFLGVNGLSPNQGCTLPSIREADLARDFIHMANEVVIVADFSKFGKVSHAKICSLEDIDTIITDSGLSDEYEELFKEFELELMLV